MTGEPRPAAAGAPPPGPLRGCVLAAGFGQRLAPITETVPKPLLPVGNVPLIGYALRLLAHHGIDEVMVNLHHLGRVVSEALADGSAYGVKLSYSLEHEILGTGGGLKQMHAHIDRTCVVLNSDTIFDLDLTAAIASHRASGALATMVLRPDPAREHGQIEILGDGQAGPIQRILGQGEAHPAARSYMFAGVHIVEPRFLEYLPPAVQTCVVRYGYLKALSNREPLWGVVSTGYWRDAGTPRAYGEAHRDALHQAMPLRHVDPLAGYALSPRHPVAETVRMGEEVELGDGVQLQAPLLLGDGVRLGERVQLGPTTSLGAKVVVGKEAQIRESVVLPGARIEAGAEVVRRLVGRRASLSLEDTP